MQEQDGAALCTQKILNLVPVVCAAKDAEMDWPNDVCCQTYKVTEEQYSRSAQNSRSGGALGISSSRGSTCFLNHLFSEP